jgi:hypothetical protein
MSSSDANAALIALLNNESNTLNRYVPIFIYIFGIIGNFLNVLVLGQRPLRSNPSAIFFITSSVAGLIAIVSGLTSRMMAGYAVDLTLTVRWICIVRNYILYSARTVALWMITLAAIDRWLSSNADANLRRMSTMKNAQRSIVAVLIFACLIDGPIIYCYQANLTGALRGCYGSPYVCACLTDLIYAVLTSVLPLIFMVIFGLLTIQNVRHTRNRIQDITMQSMSHQNRSNPTEITAQRQSRKRDRYLLKMLFTQVTLLCLFTCGHPILKAYSSITSNSPSSAFQTALVNFIFTILTLLNFTASGMPFYIYTLSGGSIFRNAILDLIKTAGRKFLCR